MVRVETRELKTTTLDALPEDILALFLHSSKQSSVKRIILPGLAKRFFAVVFLFVAISQRIFHDLNSKSNYNFEVVRIHDK